LRDGGNSVIVVEHDRDMMLESDHLIDIGPGAGIHGGKSSHKVILNNWLPGKV
jgi:excinuclease ABC subunit A